MTALIAALDILLAISGFLGGRAMMLDPTGNSVHMPRQWLQRVPLVKDYKLPGIFLISMYGLGGSLAAIGTIYEYAWAQEFNMGLGMILMAWILVELIFIPQRHPIQLFYFLLGLSLIVLPLL